jgi:hypothetical protein
VAGVRCLYSIANARVVLMDVPSNLGIPSDVRFTRAYERRRLGAGRWYPRRPFSPFVGDPLAISKLLGDDQASESEVCLADRLVLVLG